MDSTSAAIAKAQFLEEARDNENDLLAQRATWLVLSQSFLFGTFALVADQVSQEAAPSSIARILFRAIPIVGLSLAVLVELSVAAAVYMLWSLQRQLVVLVESHDLATVCWPTARRPTWVIVLGQLPSLLAPIGLAAVWIVLLAQPDT